MEPQSGHLHNGTLNDRSRETTRFGEGQLSQERTQFPETSAKKTDGCLQPDAGAARKKTNFQSQRLQRVGGFIDERQLSGRPVQVE